MEEKGRSWKDFHIRTAANTIKKENSGMEKSAQVTSSAGISGGGAFFTRPLDYRPELASPDRWSYPQDITQRNGIWRMFYEMDPVAGTVIDIYAEMAMSDYDIVGPGVDGEIQDDLEDMCEEIRLGQLMSTIMKEFLVIGESVPHLFYDKGMGYWTDWSLHKQENVELLDTQLLGMDPILYLTASTEEVRELKKIMKLSESFDVDVPGRGFLSTLLSNKKAPLEPLNVTFIPRLLHPYNVRGTSIFSRLWRIWMYEDSIMNACFAKGTKVTMSDFSLKNIEDVKVGDTVLDRASKKAEVLDAWEEKSIDNQLEFNIYGGHKFTCTEKHKFPVYRKYNHSSVAKKVWSRNYTECQGCGRNDRYYQVRGLCYVCYSQWQRGKLMIDLVPEALGRTFKYSACGTGSRGFLVPEYYNGIKTVEAKDIQSGDYLMIPRKLSNNDPLYVSIEDRVKARLLGYYVAEGSKVKLGKSGKIGVNWALNINEKDTWGSDIQRCCKILGIETQKYCYEYNHSCVVAFARHEHDDFAKWLLENGGEYSRTKRLSEEVMRWPIELKKELLIGMYRGDGSYNKKGKSVGYCTGSVDLANQVRLLLIELGYFASLRYTHELYDVGVYGSNGVFNLIKMIWDEEVPKYNGKEGKTIKTVPEWWMDDEYMYVKVKSIADAEEKKPVYNLTVSGDHSYLVDGGVATFNSIQTAKRHSSPVKTVSMGDLASGFIPSEQQEQQLLQALAQSEMDPHAWILVPPGTKFDAWGTVERAMSIRNEYDVIERMKLLALGTSKDFISGASTFASAQAGLQVFLSRLLAFRTFIEEIFINPKVFGVISRVRKWYVPTQAELSHRLRLNKEDRFVKPRLRWEKSLKTRVDKELLDAYSDLVERFHMKVSERSISEAAGLDWSDEVRKTLQEDFLKKALGEEAAKELGVPSGGLGGGVSPELGEEEVPTEEKSLEEFAPEPMYLEEEVAPMHAGSKKKVDKILTYLDKENTKISRDGFLCGMYSKKERLPKDVKEEKLL